MGEIEESAKAATAIALTTGKGIDAGRELGGFFRSIFGPALEELGASLHDRVRLYRAERLLHFQDRFEVVRAKLGIGGDLRSVPFKFGIPLIEAVAVEEEETIRDMFAALLANATDSGGDTEARKAFVDVLASMEALDAALLLAVYNSPWPEATRQFRGVYTAKLPEEFIAEIDPTAPSIAPRQEVALSLSNLARLGCIEPGGGYGGVTTFNVVTMTPFGIALIRSCTIPQQWVSREGSD